MVRVFAPQVIDVKADHGVIDKALKKLVHQIKIKTTHGSPHESTVKLQSRTSRKIDHNPR